MRPGPAPGVTPGTDYDPACRACPRLAAFLDSVRTENPGYWCKPVPPFGDPKAPFVIVGLAPGLHGANATGRPFTGDWCGPLLYSSLFRFGFASAPASVARDDGLELFGCRISNAVKCLPPENKPTPAEIQTCNHYLAWELGHAPEVRVILALGAVAHEATLRAFGLARSAYRFGHHARHVLPSGPVLIDSYHVSRYNTQTGRLTEAMFHRVLADVRATLGD